MKQIRHFMLPFNDRNGSSQYINYVKCCLRNAKYTEVEVNSQTFSGAANFIDCVKWCEDTYPSDYIQFGWSFWFTKKEQAMHFKLSWF
jgi:hypothetical protein